MPPSGVVDRDLVLSSSYHNWTLPLGDGPQAIGFDDSLVTAGGIQDPPYAFFRNGYLDMGVDSEIKYWEEGNYAMPLGVSAIRIKGEGSSEWDSTAYNMILVNETERFIDKHLNERPDDPFFAYVALGAVHLPHSPPDNYLDGTPIAGKYNSEMLDMVFEMDKVVGSLVNMIETRQLQEDTIIIFTSDNGGLNPNVTSGATELGHSSSGPLRGRKGMIYEGGHRVPMIWRHDGVIPAGEKRHHLLGLNDIYATLCDLAGIDVPKSSAKDSVSFADYLLSESSSNELRSVLGNWEFKSGKEYASASLRKNSMKVIQNYTSPSTVELYHLDNDLSESNDLSSDVSYSTLIAEMLSALDQIGPCPRDQRGRFNVTVNSKLKSVTCRWTARKTRRCKAHKKIARKKCPRTCGRHAKWCRQMQ